MTNIIRGQYPQFSTLFRELQNGAESIQEESLVSEDNKNEGQELRQWGIKEVAKLFNVSDATIRKLSQAGTIPEGSLRSNNRRFYSIDEIYAIREYYINLNPQKYDTLGRFREHELCEIVAVANQKGGVAKTTVAVQLAQKLAFNGYRVCLVDLDPQGSATCMMGFVPGMDFTEEQTIVPYLLRKSPKRVDEFQPDDLAYCLIETRWGENLQLIPGNVALSQAEGHMPYMQMAGIPNFFFWRELKEGLDTIKHAFDVIILDCPPNTGYLSVNALYASNAIVVPQPPNMLDFCSSAGFFQNLADVTEIVEENENRTLDIDFIQILPTRCPAITDTIIAENQDDKKKATQSYNILNHMRQIYGANFSQTMMLNSEAIRACSKVFRSVYEMEKWDVSLQTVRRCMESVEAVNQEIELNIYKSLEARYAEITAKIDSESNHSQTELA